MKSPLRKIMKRSRSIRHKSPNRKIVKKSRSIRHKSPNRNIVKRSRSIRRKSPNRKIMKRSRSIRHKSPNRKIMKRSRSIRHKSPNRKNMKKSRSIRSKSPNRKNIRLRGGVADQCYVCGTTKNLKHAGTWNSVPYYQCQKKKKCDEQITLNEAKKKAEETELKKQKDLAAKEKLENDKNLATEVDIIIKDIKKWADKRKRIVKKNFAADEAFLLQWSDENIRDLYMYDITMEMNENLQKIDELASMQIDFIEIQSPFFMVEKLRKKEEAQKAKRERERAEYDSLQDFRDSLGLKIRKGSLSVEELELKKKQQAEHKAYQEEKTRKRIEDAIKTDEYQLKGRMLISYGVDSINKINPRFSMPNAHSIEVHCTSLRLEVASGPLGDIDKFLGHVSLYIYRNVPSNPEIYHYGINPDTTSATTLEPEFWTKNDSTGRITKKLENNEIYLTNVPEYRSFFPEGNSARDLLLSYYHFCIAACPLRSLGRSKQNLKSLREMTSWVPKDATYYTEDQDLREIDPHIEKLPYDERLKIIKNMGLQLKNTRETDSTGKQKEELTYDDVLLGRTK